MRILISESEIELIPPKIKSIIQKRLGNNPRTLWVTHEILDSNYHHSFMKNIEERDRRGRPDILYITLHTLLSSRQFINNQIEVYFGTRDNKYFKIMPGTRIPRSYNRFCGILQKLLEGKRNPWIIKTPYQEIIKDHRIILFDENGNKSIEEYNPYKNDLIIIGGFPRGGFRGSYNPKLTIRIGDSELDTWAVASEILCKIK